MAYIGAGITRFNTADELTVTGDAQIDGTTLVIDSTNNRVGVGTASPATALDITGTVTADGLTVDGDTVLDVTRSNTAGQGFLTIQQDGSTTHKWEHRFTTDRDYRIDHYNGSSWNTRLSLEDNGDISFYDSTGVTQGFFWDASAQRLGLGTTAVSDIFTVKGSGVNQILTSLQAGGTSSECRIELIGTNSTSGVSQQVHIGAYQPSGGANTDAALDFRVRKDGDSFDSPTTIMTLTDGNVGIGTSSPASALHVVKNSTTLRLHRTGGTSGFFELASFRNNAGDGAVGSIVRVNDASVQYNTSSDYRLKTSVVYDWDATTRLKQLKPARFEWISDGEDAVPVDGFLAHEAQAVVPECVSGTKDEVDDDGNPVYQGIDQSKLVPLLVKTIQELEARITALEAN